MIKNLTRLKQVGTLEAYLERRDRAVYDSFLDGVKQREIGKPVGLSESRVKAICAEQKKLRDSQWGTALEKDQKL